MINLPFLDAKVIFLLALCVSLSVNHLSICFNRFSIEFPVFFFVEFPGLSSLLSFCRYVNKLGPCDKALLSKF